ncbi:RecX family transcriptional regulator [Gudongella oleilytica]|jgi:regulatory protein|uniref:regulatory protein RecX n=1 Tax=Gudongella oleilytica TaxID=1582259 RepID=UPI002A362A90|nr:RecX family transcriptional regulator [Gudongella oleilytica]MDY0257718.1 RecX family transcriptional regulator [Gudongella oleilytica]
MKITKISPQKDSSRINLYVDGEFYLGLPSEAIIEFKLKKDMELDHETAQRLQCYDELQRTKSSAYKYLSYRQRTVSEMMDYLARKGFEQQSISNVIELLKESGFLNDESFARAYVDDKTRLNDLGAYRLKAELRKKGIDKDLIKETLSDLEPDIEHLVELVQKKYSNSLTGDENSTMRKAAGFLQRKGYGYDVIKKVLEKLGSVEE